MRVLLGVGRHLERDSTMAVRWTSARDFAHPKKSGWNLAHAQQNAHTFSIAVAGGVVHKERAGAILTLVVLNLH